MDTNTANPKSSPSPPDAGRRGAFARAGAFFLLWMVLMRSVKPGDLALGLFATACATWTSLRLLPPAAGKLHFGALMKLAPHFVWESIVAGVDVARRVFDPRLPIRPGFVDCPLDFPPGFARNTFATITSLMPGAVPIDGDEKALEYHCIDTSQSVVEQLWKEEARLALALEAGQRHG